MGKRVFFVMTLMCLATFAVIVGCQMGHSDDGAVNTKSAAYAVTSSSELEVCDATPKLDLKVRMVSNENNHLKYRFQVFNYDSEPVAVDDLEMRLWMNDSSDGLVVEPWYGGHLFGPNNEWGGMLGPIAGNSPNLATTCDFPAGRMANKAVSITSTDGTMSIAPNGGKWVDAHFGVYRSDWQAFDTSDDYSRQSSEPDMTYQPHDPQGTTYDDNAYFALYYQGNPVGEWVSSSEADPLSGAEPQCFRTCFNRGDILIPHEEEDEAKIDSILQLMIERPEYAQELYDSRVIPMTQNQGTILVSVQLKTTGGDTSAISGFLDQPLFKVGEYLGGYIDVTKIEQLKNMPGVVAVGVDRFLNTSLDTSRPGVEADYVYDTLGVTGEGAIVGVVDTGIDWRHLDFQYEEDETKILKIWRQRGEAQPGETPGIIEIDGVPHQTGAIFDQAAINTALENDTNAGVTSFDYDGHGTHVAGIAASTGLGSGNVGMAPGADLMVVQAALSDDEGYFNENYIIAATRYLLEEADALNRPIAINHSLGAPLGPHDGSDFYNQAIGQLQESYESSAIVVAAGNDANKSVHTSETLSINDHFPQIYLAKIYSLDTAAAYGTKNFMHLNGWLDAGGSYSTITVSLSRHDPFYQPYDTVLAAQARQGETVTRQFQFGGVAVEVEVIANVTSPLNNRANFDIICRFSDIPAFTDEQLMWNIEIDTDPYIPEGGTTPVQGQGGTVHLWRHAYSETGGTLFSGFASNPNTEVSSLTNNACADKVITVGAYNEEVGGLHHGVATNFSGQGPVPERPELQKPDISAPGTGDAVSAPGIHSAMSYGTGACLNGTAVSAGTSMAAPHVAGVAALMFSANPYYTYQGIKILLRNTAVEDAETGAVPNTVWGFGKLDARGAVKAAADLLEPRPDVFDNNIRRWEGAMSGDGSQVVAWVQDTSDYPFNQAIYMSKTYLDGTRMADVSLIDYGPEDNFSEVHVAANNDGRYVVVWEGYGPYGSSDKDIQAKVYGQWGELITSLHPNEVMIGRQNVPRVAFMGEKIAFMWRSPEDGAEYEWDDNYIKARVYDLSTGAYEGPEVFVYAPGSPAEGFDQEQGDIAMDSSGNIVVVWSEDTEGDGAYVIQGSYKRAAESSFSAPFTISTGDITTDKGHTRPKVDINEDGKYVVTWVHNANLWREGELRCALYDLNNANTEVFNQSLNLYGMTSPDVAMLRDQRFKIAFTQTGLTMAVLYNVEGEIVNPAYRVFDNGPAHTQWGPSISSSKNAIGMGFILWLDVLIEPDPNEYNLLGKYFHY